MNSFIVIKFPITQISCSRLRHHYQVFYSTSTNCVFCIFAVVIRICLNYYVVSSTLADKSKLFLFGNVFRSKIMYT